MALTLETLLEKTKDTYQMKILAGKNGLYRTPLWLYFSENIENIYFLKGGELILITGFSSTGEDWLYHYIRSIIEANASGLIINTGKYLTEQDISKKVITLCNEAQFPLITIPWEVHLADLTQDMCRHIFESSHQFDDISYILMALANGDKLRRRDAALLENSFFPLQGKYCIAVFTMSQQPNSARLLTLTINEFFNKDKQACSYFLFQGFHVLLFQNMEPPAVRQKTESLITQLSSVYRLPDIIYGIGTMVTDIEKIAQSFQTAIEAHLFAKDTAQQYQLYDELGIYKLFFSLPDKTLLKSYCHCLDPVIQYDKLHNTDLLQTLYLYLNRNKSIKAVADSLFCHRNTINYRISQIRSLLTLNLENDQDIFTLQLAFHVMRYFGELKEPADSYNCNKIK